MKKILIIGIGAGDPDHITMQAVKALNQVDVFFMMDKGASKEKLMALRKEICRRYIDGDAYRFLDATSPDWERGSADYASTIEKLNQDKQAAFERLIADGMADGECGAFLVWGDPALYDSTIRNIDSIVARGAIDLDYEVIPGISSLQALTARHKITLNTISRPVEITTGRRLAAGLPDGVDSIAVMLDARNTYQQFRGHGIDIYWGAYVGTPDEILIAGKLDDVADEIERVRGAARAANGWIMDSYLLRRSDVTSDDIEE